MFVKIIISLVFISGSLYSLIAQRDTLHQVRFPYQDGYYQVFIGERVTQDHAPHDSVIQKRLPLEFSQRIIEETQTESAEWYRFFTRAAVGSTGIEGEYFVSRNHSGVYRWHAGSDWNQLICPSALYKGLWWTSKHKGQMYIVKVVHTDTLINTPFGSHRCFVIQTEVQNLYYQGVKAWSVTYDYYDTLIGKVLSVTTIFKKKKQLVLFREYMELLEYRIGNPG